MGIPMKREEMVVACCSDLAGKVRGKAFSASEFDKRLQRGVGWTPTNVQITCFDTIGESPFGSLGDLLLIPDPSTRVRVELGEGEPVEHFVVGNIRHTSGEPWEFCTRSILQGALERLEKVAGLTLFGAFEHEFQFRDHAGDGGGAFSMDGFRAERGFAESLFAALREAGVSPDTFLREFGSGQFEVTIKPQPGVAIADHSLITREMVQTIARLSGRKVTFTPLRDPAGIGNGVHIHMSFLDADGKPATYDPSGRHDLSKEAGQFVAGILKYLDSIVAITAPSVVSYLRLTPHRWSAAFNNLGYRDREAAIRICPVSDISDIAKASQFNFEFRAADCTASPYLQLAALVHAGVQGVEEGLETPEATEDDLSTLDAAALKARGYARLPETLEAALERFAANSLVRSWFPEGFADTYVKHKKAEMSFLSGRDSAGICRAYEQVY